ncbi:MAG: transporter [Clostridia bacterium]|nr:transporter [Clostridia bacterium]
MNKGILYIILAATLWGIFPSFSRFLLAEGVDPISAAAMRTYTAALIYLIYGLKLNIFKGIKIKHLPFYAGYGLTAVFGLYLSYQLAIKMLPASMAAVLLYTAPCFVILFSRIIYKEKITINKILAMIFTFIGCFLVVGAYNVNFLNFNLNGIIFGLLSGLCYSCLTLFGRKGLSLYRSEVNTILPVFFSVLFFSIIKPIWQVPMFSLEVFGLYLVIGIFGSVLPYLLYLKGMQSGVEGGDASVISTWEPVVASIAGTIVFDDKMGIIQFIGIFLVVMGSSIPIFMRKISLKKL